VRNTRKYLVTCTQRYYNKKSIGCEAERGLWQSRYARVKTQRHDYHASPPTSVKPFAFRALLAIRCGSMAQEKGIRPHSVRGKTAGTPGVVENHNLDMDGSTPSPAINGVIFQLAGRLSPKQLTVVRVGLIPPALSVS
jgi:hypothetical protein